MTVGEVSRLMAWTSERRQDLSALVVQHVHGFVPAVHHVHVLLCSVPREGNPPRCSSSIGKRRRSRTNPDITDELSALVEHLHAVALSIADIDQSGVADGDAMHDVGKHPGCAGFRLCGRRFRAPLPDEAPIAVEHGNSLVAVAIGHVDVAVRRIDRHTGWIEEPLTTGVLERAPAGPVRGIELSPRADLHQQLAVVAVLLNDAVVVPSHIQVVLAVERAAVNRARHCIRIPEGRHQRADPIEHENRRRLHAGFDLLFGDVSTVDDSDVVVRVGAHATQLTSDPLVGERFRPRRVQVEVEGLRPARRRKDGDQEDSNHQSAHVHLTRTFCPPDTRRQSTACS